MSSRVPGRARRIAGMQSHDLDDKVPHFGLINDLVVTKYITVALAKVDGAKTVT